MEVSLQWCVLSYFMLHSRKNCLNQQDPFWQDSFLGAQSIYDDLCQVEKIKIEETPSFPL